MVTIINVSRRAQVYNLPHSAVCNETKCHCAQHEHRQTEHNKKTGDVGVRVLSLKLSPSLHLQPGEEVTAPDGAEKAPEIVSAKARGDIQVKTAASPAPVKA